MIKPYYFGKDKFPIGTKIKIKGERHAKSGKIGQVIGYDHLNKHNLIVKLPEGSYLVKSRNLESIND